MPPGAPGKLSRREREVAQLVAEGLSNYEIAQRLFIAVRTVEYHVEQTFNKLGFHSRTQIAGWIAAQRAAPETTDVQKARTNLPVQLTSFVGREAELIEVRNLLDRSRLVTLIGPGGVGKTRLALQIASATAGAYDDGVWLVELAGVSDEDLVVQPIASAVAIPEMPGQPLVESLVGRMAAWKTLILLDNCEHLIEAVASISEQMLKGCPSLRVLATSREALRVSGEVIWQVPTLALAAAEDVSHGTASRSEAIRLFVDRGQHANARFNPTPNDIRSVAEICRRLDGMPLAIELAAARLSVMSPDTILDNLDRRFQILTVGSRNVVPRHRTLEATFDWSYGLLAERERILFDRLAIFVGGFTVEAAEAVCDDEPLAREEILPLVLRLCECSLVSTQRPTAGQTRYRMLETLRQYGSGHLEANEKESLNRRHAEYFDWLAVQALRGSMSRRRGEWINRLQQDIDNLMAALDWALTAEPEIALRLATNLEFFWRVGPYLTEALDRMTSALERVPERSLLRAQGLTTAGLLAVRVGRYADCRRWLKEMLDIARATARPADLGYMIARAGIVQEDLDPKEADALIREGLELWVPSGDLQLDQYKLGVTLADLGWVSYVLHDLDAALDYSNQALTILEGGNASPHLHGVILDTLAFVALGKGDLAGATIHWRSELAIGVDLHDEAKIMLGLLGLGNAAAADSRPLRAQRLFGAAETVRERIGRVLMPSSDAAHFAPWRKLARDALDPKAADEAWSEGARMTTEEAVAYALSEAGPD